MKSPITRFEWVEVEEADSTQRLAAEAVRAGTNAGVVFAHHQSAGRGRFDRQWVSQRGESLTMSLIFRDYADHPKPYLVGMTLAVAAAAELHAQLRWPNDLCLHGRKLGGVLTEIVADSQGRGVPVVGLGINLNQEQFPVDLGGRATSAKLEHGKTFSPEAVARAILTRLANLPEPSDWSAFATTWALFDDTPGKCYTLQDGRIATAVGIGPSGELLCSVAGEPHSELAADAIFGSP